MIAAAIYARALAVPHLTALIGDRIYPGAAPENPVWPYVVFEMLTAGAGQAKPMAGRNRHFRTMQQFVIHARTELNATAIAAALRTAFDAHINQVWAGMTIPASRFDDAIGAGFDPEINGYRLVHQYRIVYKEA